MKLAALVLSIFSSLALTGCSGNDTSVRAVYNLIGLRSAVGASSTSAIKFAHSSKCLDVNGASTDIGLQLQQWDCNGSSAQNFVFNPQADGSYEIQTSTGSGLCVDVSGASPLPGAIVQQYSCNGSPAQRFNLVSRDSGYEIHPAFNQSACLDVSAVSQASGAKVITYPCTGGANELTYESVSGAAAPVLAASGTTPIKFAHSSKCLDVNSSSTSAGVQLQQWDCNGTNAQNFSLLPQADGSYEIQTGTGLCVDVSGASTQPGALVQQWSCNNTPAQRFNLVARSGGYEIHPAFNSSACVDLSGNVQDSGAKVITYPCTGGANELVYLNLNATAPAPTPTPAPASSNVAVGIYEGSVAISAIASYETFLNRKMDYINDTVPSENWDNMTNSSLYWYFLLNWATVGGQDRLVITMPMVPTYGVYSGPSLNDVDAAKALQDGANGVDDAYWVNARKAMLAAGFTHNYIRLGWEMNGNWYNWRANVNPTAWVSYWRRIATILNDDPSAHFRFVWNPTLADQNIAAETVYPGDDLVDSIGIDVYDSDYSNYPATGNVLATQQYVWEHTVLNGPHGLSFYSNFAKMHGKQIQIDEWGVGYSTDHMGGDDTYFVQSLYNWAHDPANNVSLMMYFDSPKLMPPTDFPNSSALVKQLLGK